MFTAQQWILLIAFVVPMLTLIGIVRVWRWRQDIRQGRAPVSDKLLRPAGESLRRETEILDEEIDLNLIGAFFGPGFVTAFFMVSNPLYRTGGNFVATAIAAAWFAFHVWKLIGLVQRRENYRLGYAGERAVAEELNQLMLNGCRIFHDVPMDPYGNIDHVVVAPRGIFSVETKARRKKKAPPGKRDHELFFDGEHLIFPQSTETDGLKQARQQADRLRVFLTKAVGEPVPVQPILTFPGWYVTTRARSDLKVLNPKAIRSAIINSQGPILSEQLRQRIAHQLDQKCRDVEF